MKRAARARARPVPDLALVVLTVAWGSTFLVVKGALAGTSAGAFLALRFAAATAVAIGVAVIRRARISAGAARDGALLGLALFVGLALQTLGLERTTPARSAFLTGLSVVLVPFLSTFALGRPVRPAAWGGVALAAAGLLALMRPFGGGAAPGVLAGDLLTALCAVAFAFQVVFTSEWSPRHPLAALTLVQVATAAALSPLLLPFTGCRAAPGPALWAAALFTGGLMTTGAFLVVNWAQRHTGPVRAALIYALEPVAAALFSHLAGAERLTLLDCVGGALVVAGVVLGEVGSARSGPGR